MTLEQMFHQKYLNHMKNIKEKDWNEVLQISKAENKKPAEIIFRVIYITFNDYRDLRDDEEFWKSLYYAKDNHYIKESRMKYSNDRYYLTIKGLKAYKVI